MLNEKMTMTKTKNMPTFSKGSVEHKIDKKSKGKSRDKISRSNFVKNLFAGMSIRDIVLGESE